MPTRATGAVETPVTGIVRPRGEEASVGLPVAYAATTRKERVAGAGVLTSRNRGLRGGPVTALPAGRIEPLRAATRLRPPRTGPHPTRAKAATDPQCLPMTWQITSP